MTTLQEQTLPDGTNAWWVDTTDWPAGMYVVSVHESNGAVATRKVMKF